MKKKPSTTGHAKPVASTGGFRAQPFIWGLLGGLGVLLALVIGGVVGQLGTVLVYITIALFLALGLDPLVSLLERRMPRGLAILFIVLGVLAIVAGILLTLIPVIVEQIANLSRNLPEWIRDFQDSELYQNLEAQFGGVVSDAVDQATDWLGSNAGALTGGVLAVGSGIASAVTGATVVLILTLYFMGSLRGMKRLATRFVPAYRRSGFADVLDDVTVSVGRYVMGQAALAVISSVVTLVLMLILGAPLPILLAVISFLGSLIPMVGTVVAAAINTAICLAVSPVAAIIAGVFYLVYMQIEAYVITPRVMSKAVSVPGALVVIGAVGGGSVGGMLGALLAVPVIASIMIILQKVVFPRLDRMTRDPNQEPALIIAK